MDIAPTQGTAYSPQDRITLVGHPDCMVRVQYEDWNGVVQERNIGKGTWPLKSTKLLGVRYLDSQGTNGWSDTLSDLSTLAPGIELSVSRA